MNWFKFIQPSLKPRMTETPVQKLVHVASSPIAFMNYKWIIILHDGYDLLHILPPEEYIPPSFHTLCNLKPTMLHIGEDHLCSHKILIPPGVPGKNLEANATVDKESDDEISQLREPIGPKESLMAPGPNLIRCKYNVLDVWETGEKTYVLTSAPTTDDPVIYVTYAKEHDLQHADGWTWHVSSIASLKGEMRSPAVGLVFSRSPHQALYVLVNLHLESPIKSSCYVATHQALSATLHLQNSIKELSIVAPSTPLFVTLLIILDLLSLYQ